MGPRWVGAKGGLANLCIETSLVFTMGETSSQPGLQEMLEGWEWYQSMQRMPWWCLGPVVRS